MHSSSVFIPCMDAYLTFPIRCLPAGPGRCIWPRGGRSSSTLPSRAAIYYRRSAERLRYGNAVPRSLAAATPPLSSPYRAAPPCSLAGRLGLVFKNTGGGGCITISDRTAAATVPPRLTSCPSHAGPESTEFLAPTTRRWGASYISCGNRGFTPDPRSEAVVGRRLTTHI